MTHAEECIPDYVLLAHFNDDTHEVICHFHNDIPYVNDLAVDYNGLDEEQKGNFVRFQFANIMFDTTIDRLIAREQTPCQPPATNCRIDRRDDPCEANRVGPSKA